MKLNPFDFSSCKSKEEIDSALYFRLFLLFLGALVFFVWANVAHATDCPPGAKSCKVITITPDEEQTLVGPNGILDLAEWASRPLTPMIYQWRRKIETAPAGDVAKPENKK